jgi:XTP/dITP diphosphohydrolase
VVVATGNPGKVREIRAILGALPAEVCSLEALGAVDFPDEGDEYAPNARAKALAVATQLGEIAVADDSGLEVDALDGGPGPLSARYGGPGLDDRGRVDHLLSALSGLPESQRAARFVCVAALAMPDGAVETFRGECAGRILVERSGEGGFGYDPVFGLPERGCSMAELSADEKDRISHRGRAFATLRPRLLELLGKS